MKQPRWKVGERARQRTGMRERVCVCAKERERERDQFPSIAFSQFRRWESK